MHGSIRERLEDLLAAGDAAAGSDSQTHLSACQKCSAELGVMKAQAEVMKTLRAPEELEPSAGFYARVLQRIEDTGIESIWSVFRYSPAGKRLVYASLSLALIMGTYVITEEARDGHLGGDSQESSLAVNVRFHDAPVIGSPAQQRDAVLVNFVSHRGSLQ